MHVHYINLDRRKDRNERFLRLNSGIAEFERISAVEGSKLETEQLIADGILQEPLQAYSPGALGNAMSHKQLWDLAVAAATMLTIAEDDAVFNRHFGTRGLDVLRRLPPDWDIVLWGWNFDSILHVELLDGWKETVMHFDSQKMGERVLEFRERHYDVLPMWLRGAFGIVGYSVSAKGAQRLIESCFPLRNESIFIPGLRRKLRNFTLDTAMNKQFPSLKAYASFPPLVYTDNDKTHSDVVTE